LFSTPQRGRKEERGSGLAGKIIRHWKWIPASAGMTALGRGCQNSKGGCPGAVCQKAFKMAFFML
jgi:hypothetical protein